MGPDYGVSNARGLGKKQLGGVIFGATKTTINECLSKQLFGQFLKFTQNQYFLGC